MKTNFKTDILIIGAGIGGCTTAITAADNGCKVVVLTSGNDIEKTSTVRAQGGIIYKGIKDTQKSLIDNIENAGDGMCNPEAVKHLVKEGPKLVKDFLIDKIGVLFDKNKNGKFDLTREGGHNIERIVHCSDSTGKSIAEALWEKVKKHKNITVFKNTTAIDLITTSHHSLNFVDVYLPITCVGAYVLRQKPHKIIKIFAKETVLATGGLGQVYLHTTNGKGLRGDGFAMALRASARIANMEFIQFHPTTLYGTDADNFLITESLRGEGGILINANGEKFAEKYHKFGSLAPRDIVSRAIHNEMLKTHQSFVYLDISHKPAEWLKNRFPTIYNKCLEHKIDITKMPIPIVPAAHYACGGVMVDKFGKTSVPRLRAVGEVSCTGVHGANRLASTSLLEGLTWGVWTGKDIARNINETKNFFFPKTAPWIEKNEEVDISLLNQDWMIIKHTMWNYVGLIRGERRLRRAQRILRELQTEVETFYRRVEMSDEIIGLRNGLQTARAILYAAIRNARSKGCHYREEQK
jgi:L-aspartate oxidase